MMFSKVACVLTWLLLLLPYKLTQIQVLRLYHMFYILDLFVTFRQCYNRIGIVIIAIIYRNT